MWMGYVMMVLALLAGMALIVVEVFLPGFGLPGISGIALLAGGIAMAGAKFGSLTAVGILLVSVAVLAVLISWMLRSAACGKSAHSRFFLGEKDEIKSQEDMQVLVGKQGKASSALHPAGIGDFDGVRLNVVTEGNFIDPGEAIEIARVDGGRIVVRSTGKAL